MKLRGQVKIARAEKINERNRVQEESEGTAQATRESDFQEKHEGQERKRRVRPVCQPRSDGGAYPAILAVRFRLQEQSAPDGAHRRERHLQCRSDRIWREIPGARAGRRRGPEIFLGSGGKPKWRG